jgi:FkbM family methyltransferase
MLKIDYGTKYSIEFPHYFSHDVGWYQKAEKKTKEYFLDIIKPDHNIIDAGAQIGMYTVLFSKLAHKGNVFAFEPTETIELLRKNLDYNNCNNVSLHDIPLSSKEENKIDKIYRIWSKNVIVEKEFSFTTIDSFINKNNLHIDLIKIDVDSYDYEVLLGSKNYLTKCNPIIVVELNHALNKRGYTVKHPIEFMNSIGYRVEHVLDNENYVFKKI